MNTYTVKPGDSLSIIARDILGNLERWPEIATLNNITNADLIHPGQELLLPDDTGAGAPDPAPAEKKKRIVWIIAAVIIAVVIIAAVYYKKKG